MPSDILGAEVLDESSSGKRSFRFISGPVFAQLLMADEINRASPRTQSALLQAMQEQHITVAGARHDLPKPFHVLATQNPLEQEGTYPLPEAQLDRFLMEIDVDYPGSRRGAPHPVRNHRRRRDRGQGGHERRKFCSPRNGWCGGCRSAIPWSRQFSRWCAPRVRARKAARPAS